MGKAELDNLVRTTQLKLEPPAAAEFRIHRSAGARR